ncbi:MAG TPA: sialidase family protein, partial [Gemmatimonadaceae bacterium]|nr:sialidase family protein [Gemmatimonadaceae bacterium]
MRRTSITLTLATLLVGGLACGREPRSAEATPVVGSLGALEPLATPAPPGSAEPNLTVARGRAYLSWIEPTPDSGHALRFATLEGRGWSAPRTIARGKRWFVNWADFPSLVVLPSGRLAAHWLERSSEGKYSYDVRVATSRDGGATWSRPVTPHRDASASEHGFVAMWGQGDTLSLVWLDGRKYARIPIQEEAYSKEMMLLSTTILPDGSRGPERRVDERTCDCCQTSVAQTARGPLVAYRDRTTDEIRDIHVSRFERSYWTPPRRVHADQWKVDYCPVNGPSVAARGERAAVAWFTGARDTARVMIAFSTDAGDTF